MVVIDACFGDFMIGEMKDGAFRVWGAILSRGIESNFTLGGITIGRRDPTYFRCLVRGRASVLRESRLPQ